MNLCKPRLTAIQLNSEPSIDKNLQVIDSQLEQLIDEYGYSSEHIVVLPEACLFFGSMDIKQNQIKESYGNGYMQTALAALAKKHKVTLLAGTIPINDICSDKFTASSLLFSAEGEIIDHYKKIHLFDVDINDSEKQYRESAVTAYGDELICHSMKTINLGLTVCYDLRFPELFRALRALEANVIAVPSAFTELTGRAHWHTLLQARAIENQVYIVAANQHGTHENGRKTYGHSMIVDPWGHIVTQKTNGTGYISTEFDKELLDKVRADIPVNTHNKFSVSLKI